MILQYFIPLLLKLTGRLVKLLFGIGLILAGIVVSLTIFGTPMGIPLILFGLLLLIRGFSR